MRTLEAVPNKRTLGLIGIVFLFLILLGLYVYVLVPLMNQAKDQEDEKTRIGQQVNILANKTAEKNKTESAYSQDSVQQALPLFDNTEQMLLDLKTVDQASRVNLLNATFSPSDSNQLQQMTGGTTSPYATVKELKVAVVIQGTYDQLVDWIDRLQQLPRLISVDTFNLTKPLAAAEQGKPISLNVNFTAYFDPSYQGLVDHVLLPYQP